MRALIVVLGLAVAGCASSSQITHHPLNAHPHGRANSRAHADSKALLTAAVLLPSHTMTAGSSMAGRVVIENKTGHVIHTAGCVSLFQVDLVNASYHPEIFWTQCYEPMTIAIGRSSYPVTVEAAYNHCTQGRPSQGVKRCLPHGSPPLPPGNYRAVLFQAGNLIPAPAAITVHVTPR